VTAAAGAEASSAANVKATKARRGGRVLLTGPVSGEQRQSTPHRF